MSIFKSLFHWFSGFRVTDNPTAPKREEPLARDYTHSLQQQQEPRYERETASFIKPDKFRLVDPVAGNSVEFHPPDRDLDNGKLRDRVFDYMSDGKWHTLADLSFACNGSEASCSARIRDFRKAQHGGHDVDRKHIGNRLYMYRLVKRGTHRIGDQFEVPF